MKNFYDKLLLGIAGMVLIGGAVLYVLKSGAIGDQGQGSGASSPASGDAYQPISIPESTAADAIWPEPIPQASGEEWLYDVFTPPKIYVDRQGNFTFIPPTLPIPPEPFGIYLAKAPSKEPYRIQIQGFSGDRKKLEECVVFLFDNERQSRVFISLGEENAESEVKVLDFEIQRITGDDNVVEVTAIATIEDLRSGEKVKLIDGKTLYNDEIQVVFRSEEDPEVLIELSVITLPEEGLPFQTPSAKYRLRGISLEDNTVIVEKIATEETESEILTLSPESSNAPLNPQLEENTPAPGGESAAETSGFDSLF